MSKVSFVGNKAEMASEKHFGGKLSKKDMGQLVRKVLSSPSYIGSSDRSNGRYAPCKIVWGEVAGIMIAVMLDGEEVKKNHALVVSIYDVQNVEYKAKRFGMKKVG